MLLYVGWPFPKSLPTISNITETINGNRQLPNSFVTKSLAIVLWFLWLQLIYVTAIELISAFKGKQANRVRSIPGIQMFASKVIGLTVVFFGFTGSSLSYSQAVENAVWIEQDDDQDQNRLDIEQVRSETTNDAIYVVKPGDSWWSIAESQINDGSSWQKIRQNNIGRKMADGSTIQKSTEVIQPGWNISIPKTMNATIMQNMVEVKEGDTLWEIAQDSIGTDDKNQINSKVEEIASLNNIANKDEIFENQILKIEEAELNTAETTDPVSQDLSKTGEEEDQVLISTSRIISNSSENNEKPISEQTTDLDEAESKKEIDYRSLLVGMGLGAGIVSTTLLSRVKNYRKFLNAHRELGTVPTKLSEDSVSIEKVLTVNENPESFSRVFSAINDFANSNSQSEVPSYVQVNEESIEIKTTDEKEKVVFDHNGLNHFSIDSVVLTPTLVSLSKNLLINLESVGVLNISGEEKNCLSMVRSMVHELSNSHGSGIVDIMTTIPIAGTRTYPLVTETNTKKIRSEAIPWLEDVGIKFSQSSISSSYNQRCDNNDEPIGPSVLVLNESQIDENIEPVIALAEQCCYPIGIIILSDIPLDRFNTRCNIVNGNEATMLDSEISFVPQLMSSEAAQAAGKLLSEIKDVQYIKSDPIQFMDLSVTAESEQIHENKSQPINIKQENNLSSKELLEAEPVLKLSILGDVDLSSEQHLTPQQLSLITYLSCNGPSLRQNIVESLWDGQRISNSRFSNLLAETRKKIGRRFLPEADNSKYSVRYVENDFHDFLEIISRSSSGSQRTEILVKALELVNGVPLGVSQSRYWTWLLENSNLAIEIQCSIADIAYEAVELLVLDSDLDKAIWACEKGLLASPLDQNLIGALAELHQLFGRSSSAIKVVEDWEYRISSLNCGEPSQEPRNRLTQPKLSGYLEQVE